MPAIRSSPGDGTGLLHGPDAQTTLFDDDDVEAEKEAELRRLALVARAYLRGEADVAYRPSLFRRRPVATVRLEVEGLDCGGSAGTSPRSRTLRTRRGSGPAVAVIGAPLTRSGKPRPMMPPARRDLPAVKKRARGTPQRGMVSKIPSRPAAP